MSSRSFGKKRIEGFVGVFVLVLVELGIVDFRPIYFAEGSSSLCREDLGNLLGFFF